jgi:hypothetical protein
LKPEALSVKISGFSIWDLMKVSSEKALEHDPGIFLFVPAITGCGTCHV